MTSQEITQVDAVQALVYKKHFGLWALFALSIISFLTTLQLPYQGEEAVYTLTSLEMWYHKQWFVPLLYGSEYGRPPLYNWAIIPLATWLGWEHMLAAARIVASLATVGSTVLLFFFTEQLFRNRKLTLLAVCIYLSGDLLWRRGWLAYADPMFSFFVFLSIMGLWFCVQHRNVYWILLAVIGLIGSYLTKAFTGYFFYAITFFVLWWRHPNTKELLKSPIFIVLHLFSIAFIFCWIHFITHGAHQQSMVFDIVSRCSFEALSSYALKLFTFPLEIIYRWLPSTVLLFYFWIKERRVFELKTSSETPGYQIKLIFWVFLFNYLIYWLAPFARVRYLLPLYPFIAILLAYGIYQFRPKQVTLAIVALWGCLLLKYFLGCYGYPYYEKVHRGSYQAAAENILNEVGETPLYADNVAATGLSIVAHLDILRLPRSPLVGSPLPEQWQDGFILSDTPISDRILDAVVAKTYQFGSRQVYLLCRGKACLKPEVKP